MPVCCTCTGINAVVYERDASRGARGQSGMLELHSGAGPEPRQA
jgi:hypothetical protein